MVKLNEDIDHITVVKWTTDEYKKILGYIGSHDYHIKDWIRAVCLNEVLQGKLEYDKIQNKFAEIKRLDEQIKKGRNGVKWLIFVLILLIFSNVALLFFTFYKSEPAKPDLLTLINECPVVNGNLIDENSKIGCSTINTRRNEVIFNVLCRKYNLRYMENATTIKCI